MTLEEIELMAALCKQCKLYKTRTHPVFAKGDPKAELMICGMIPGPDEDKVGIPFVGRAGQLLDRILANSNITLDNVYITNLVKCWLRPGLVPEPEDVAICTQYIVAQISIIQPKVIITLGQLATAFLVALPQDKRMGNVRGTVYVYSNEPRIDVIPTYHPSYLLRKGGEKSDDYPRVLEDFDLATYILKEREGRPDDKSA